MMDYSYVQALTTRAKWKLWAQQYGNITNNPEALQGICNRILGTGDTFFMNKQFCALVDQARRTVPDDLPFDMSWLQAPIGFMYLADAFEVPELTGLNKEIEANGWPKSVKEMALVTKYKPRVAAIGWMCLKNVTRPAPGSTMGTFTTSLNDAEVVQVICYLDYGRGSRAYGDGFGMWSYFNIVPGQKVLDRVHQYERRLEEEDAKYIPGRDADQLHEVRWVYTAFYLMAQRLSMTVRHDTDRATRRRNERERTPVDPYLKVITLRRMEEDRPKGTRDVDWQWQWTVTGHWRNQYMPSSGEHKHVWIESYIKGPEDKPLKSIPTKIFIAGR